MNVDEEKAPWCVVSESTCTFGTPAGRLVRAARSFDGRSRSRFDGGMRPAVISSRVQLCERPLHAGNARARQGRRKRHCAGQCMGLLPIVRLLGMYVTSDES